MSYTPLIPRNPYIFQNLGSLQVPFTPAIYACRHIKQLLSNEENILKLEHFALATLQIGTLLEAADYYYKYQQFVPPALLIVMAICATIFDVYIQQPYEIKIEKLAPNKTEMTLEALKNTSFQMGGIWINGEYTTLKQRSQNPITQSGFKFVVHMVGVTLSNKNNEETLAKALGLRDITALPVAILQQTGEFIFNGKRFKLVGANEDVVTGLNNLSTKPLLPIPTYKADQKTVAEANFTLPNPTMFTPPIRSIGLPREEHPHLLPTDKVCKEKIVVEDSEDGSILRIPQINVFNGDYFFNIYIHETTCVVRFFQEDETTKEQIGPAYWIKTETGLDLTQFHHWVSINKDTTSYKLLKSTVETTNFTLSKQLFTPPKPNNIELPTQRPISSLTAKTDIVCTDKGIKILEIENEAGHYTILIPRLLDLIDYNLEIYFTKDTIYVRYTDGKPNNPSHWISTKTLIDLTQFNNWSELKFWDDQLGFVISKESQATDQIEEAMPVIEKSEKRNEITWGNVTITDIKEIRNLLDPSLSVTLENLQKESEAKNREFGELDWINLEPVSDTVSHKLSIPIDEQPQDYSLYLINNEALLVRINGATKVKFMHIKVAENFFQNALVEPDLTNSDPNNTLIFKIADKNTTKKPQKEATQENKAEEPLPPTSAIQIPPKTESEDTIKVKWGSDEFELPQDTIFQARDEKGEIIKTLKLEELFQQANLLQETTLQKERIHIEANEKEIIITLPTQISGQTFSNNGTKFYQSPNHLLIQMSTKKGVGYRVCVERENIGCFDRFDFQRTQNGFVVTLTKAVN